jgi:hypothetical protein
MGLLLIKVGDDNPVSQNAIADEKRHPLPPEELGAKGTCVPRVMELLTKPHVGQHVLFLLQLVLLQPSGQSLDPQSEVAGS